MRPEMLKLKYVNNNNIASMEKNVKTTNFFHIAVIIFFDARIYIYQLRIRKIAVFYACTVNCVVYIDKFFG